MADQVQGTNKEKPNSEGGLSPELEKLKNESPDLFKAVADHFVGIGVGRGKNEAQRQLEQVRNEQQKLLKQLEETAAKLQDGDAEKNRLNDQIRELEGQVLSKDELAKKNLERAQAEAKKSLELLQSDAKKAQDESLKYKKRYETYLIDNTITAACTRPETEAFYAPQVIANLKPFARVEPILDDSGNETENFRVVLSVLDRKENKMKELDFNDGFKLFYEQPENANLFKSKVASGSANGVKRTPGQSNMTAASLQDYSTYLQNREQILQTPA